MPSAHATRRGGSLVIDALLWIAAVLGSICILLVVAALFFQISVIMFKTGSMSPTIPTGSAALVREIPAAEVKVGDVVTVDRPDGKLPVTHRVVAIDGSGETRSLTLRGDANPADDPAPYAVSTVRIVLFSVPGLAYALVWLAQPIVLLIGVGLLALLVGWAFWPHRRHDDPGPPAGGDVAPDDAASAGQSLGVGAGSSTGTALVVLLLAASVAAAVLGTAEPAQAAVIERTIDGSVLHLTVIEDPERMASMVPGETVNWIVGVRADAPERGLVDVKLESVDPENAAFTVAVSSCGSRWAAEACADDLRDAGLFTPVPTGVLAGQRIRDLDELWVRVAVTLNENAPPAARSELRLSASGFGEEVDADGGGAAALAATGPTEVSRFALLGIATVLIGGAVLAATGGARRRSEVRR